MEKVGKEDALPCDTATGLGLWCFLSGAKGKATLNMRRHIHVWAILFRFHIGFQMLRSYGMHEAEFYTLEPPHEHQLRSSLQIYYFQVQENSP